MKLYKWLLIFIGFWLLIITNSCSQTNLEPLRVGSTVWPGYETLYLARDLGYYGNSSNIQLIDYPSATEVTRAMRNGDLDVAALTLDETLGLIETHPDMKIILVTDVSDGGDAIVAHPTINSLQELKGKRVGVESTALGAFVLTRALEQANISIFDLEIVSMGFSEHEYSFQQGEIDAVVTFEPIRSKLLDSGANLLFDSSQIPWEIVDVLVVPEKILENRTKTLDVLIKGWFRGLDYLKNNPQNAARIIAPREQIKSEQFLQSLKLLYIPTLKENQELLSKKNPKLEKSINKLSEIMLKNNLLQKPIKKDSILNDILVKDLQ